MIFFPPSYKPYRLHINYYHLKKNTRIFIAYNCKMRIKQYLFFFFFSLWITHRIAISHHCSLRRDNWVSRIV